MTESALKLPWDADAEQAVLAGALIGADDLADVAGWLASADFHAEQHGAIWSAVRGLVETRRPVDQTTVRGALRDAQDLDPQGVIAAILARLAQALPETAGIAGQAAVVRDLARRRAVLAFAREAMREAAGGTGPVAALVDRVQTAALALSADARGIGEPRPLADAVPGVMAELEAAWAGKSPAALSTGWPGLDRKLAGGLRGGELVVVAGRPGMGKTTVAMGLASACARAERDALLFSQEQPVGQLTLRAIAGDAPMDLQTLRGRRDSDVDEREWAKVGRGIERVRQWGRRLWVDDSARLSANAVRTATRRIKVRAPALACVLIDYLQIMDIPQDAETRDRAIGETTAALKGLARELNVPVVLLSQLNRGLEKRKDKHPQLADLRDSGNIEQDADIVLMLYRDELYDENSSDKGIAEIVIAKQRNGPTGTVRLAWRGAFSRLDTLADSERYGQEPAAGPAPPARRPKPKQRDFTDPKADAE